jgi:hypothetical protein
MKNKKLFIFFIVLLLTTLPLNVSCSSNGEGAVQAENSSLSAFFLDIGYENCLMCHGESDANRKRNFSLHCLNFDPLSYTRIDDESYSPTITDCLICHTPHQSETRRTNYNCAMCHQHMAG